MFYDGLKVHANLRYVRISAACKSTHWSFASDHGGEYSFHRYITQQCPGDDQIDVYQSFAGPKQQEVNLTLMVRKDVVINIDQKLIEEDKNGKLKGK